jgi:(2Fe-2S) ferredoxin
MDQNQAVVSVMAILLVIFAGLFVYWTVFDSGTPTGPDQVWYLDTVTGEHFVGPVGEIPPFVNDDGNVSVRVRRFTCGECTEEEMFDGWYERVDPRLRDRVAQEASKGGPADPLLSVQMTAMQYSADGERWFPGGSPPAIQIMEERRRCEDGTRARGCRAKN